MFNQYEAELFSNAVWVYECREGIICGFDCTIYSGEATMIAFPAKYHGID